MRTVQQTPGADADKALQQAFRQALAFPLSRASDLAITPQQAAALAAREAASATIGIDEDGMSSGMHSALLPPARAMLAEWRDLQDAFATALADSRKERPESRYDDLMKRHANRAAVTFAGTPAYWFLICLVGVAAWFVNDGTFYAFFGMAGPAAGTAILLAVLLALSAHGHGEILKQRSYRFGAARDPAKRGTGWRVLGMATSGFLIVLSFAGVARYVAALDLLGLQRTVGVFRDPGAVRVDPLRDVVVSLLANIGVWTTGVAISYCAHDADPDYADAALRYRRARAKARAGDAGVSCEGEMLMRVNAHDRALRERLQAVIGRNADAYRDALIGIAQARGGQMRIVRGAARIPVPLADYRTMRITPPRIAA